MDKKLEWLSRHEVKAFDEIWWYECSQILEHVLVFHV